MSVKSVLHGCCEVLVESAGDFRRLDREACAYRCELQADAVLKLLTDLDNEQQEETSNGPA